MKFKRPSRVSLSRSFMAFTMAPAALKESVFKSFSVTAPEAESTSKRAETNSSRRSTGMPWTHSRSAMSLRRAWRVTWRRVTKWSPITCQEKPSCCKKPSWSLSTTA